MIADTIKLILGNLYIVFFLVAIVTTIAKVRRARIARKPLSGPFVLWGELLFYYVGFGFLWAGVFHAYFQNIAAPSIGWQPSPFEYELGWAEIALAFVAMMALFRGYQFRLAPTLIFSIFGLAAAAQHIQQMMCCQNYAPGNAGLILWFSDIFGSILMLVLAFMSRGAEHRRI